MQPPRRSAILPVNEQIKNVFCGIYSYISNGLWSRIYAIQLSIKWFSPYSLASRQSCLIINNNVIDIMIHTHNTM